MPVASAGRTAPEPARRCGRYWPVAHPPAQNGASARAGTNATANPACQPRLPAQPATAPPADPPHTARSLDHHQRHPGVAQRRNYSVPPPPHHCRTALPAGRRARECKDPANAKKYRIWQNKRPSCPCPDWSTASQRPTNSSDWAITSPRAGGKLHTIVADQVFDDRPPKQTTRQDRPTSIWQRSGGVSRARPPGSGRAGNFRSRDGHVADRGRAIFPRGRRGRRAGRRARGRSAAAGCAGPGRDQRTGW